MSPALSDNHPTRKNILTLTGASHITGRFRTVRLLLWQFGGRQIFQFQQRPLVVTIAFLCMNYNTEFIKHLKSN